MFKNRKTLWFVPLALLLLAGCGGAQKTLGLERQAPDEFKVQKHAPLELPPNYALRPPAPGAARPQEQSPSDQAKQTVFGGAAAQREKAAPTSAEAALLQNAQADYIDPDIRAKLDAEVGQFEQDKRPVAQKLLGVLGGDKPPSGDVIDPHEESTRLKAEQADDDAVSPSE